MDRGRPRRDARGRWSARSGPTGVRGLSVLSTEGTTNKSHPQSFCPTCRGFHPLGGLPDHLFTDNSPKASTKRCPAGVHPPDTSGTSCPDQLPPPHPPPPPHEEPPLHEEWPPPHEWPPECPEFPLPQDEPPPSPPAHQPPPALPPATPRRAPRLPAFDLLPALTRTETNSTIRPTAITTPTKTFTGLTPFRPPKARSPASPRFPRVWGMPPPPNGQSRLEQLQSFRAG